MIQEVVLFMGNLAYSTDEQDTRFKAQVLTMINRAIETALYPFGRKYEGHREILRVYEKRIH